MANDGVNNPQFVAQRQKEWQTPPEVIQDKALIVLNETVIIADRISKGGQNEVYVLKGQKNQYIARISHGPNQFNVENWAKDKSASAGVPVPKTYGVERVNLENKTITIEFSEFIAGETLAQLTSLSPEIKINLLQQAGKYLSRIHSVKLPVYGQVTNHPTPGPTNLAEYRLKWLNQNKTDLSLGLTSTGLSTSGVDNFLQQFSDWCKQYDEHQAILTHMDYLPRHLMVTPDHYSIAAVIDFGNCRSASPFDDFANWIGGDQFPLRDLLDGYENRSLISSSNFSNRLSLSNILLNLQQIPFAYKFKLLDKLPKTTERIVSHSSELGYHLK